MDQRYLVLGLFFSISISAENSTTLFHKALSHKPGIMDINHTAIKMKTIFLNKKFFDVDPNTHNSNRTKKLQILNASRMNYVTPISRSLKGTKLNHFSNHVRFPRQVKNINSHENDKRDNTDRYIKILLDLQPENEEEIYDYYDSQEKHISGLENDRNLNKEIENHSKLLTRNLSESQERKRCTKNNMENIGPRKLQLSQPLFSKNIEDEKKSNTDSVEFRNNFNGNSGFKKKNDDYFVNILNQLIDKLNKSKNLKSNHNKNLLARKTDEPISLENKSVGERTSNSSSEEELILRLEKIKGNRIMDRLNSSPETTFVNGKWIRNKILEKKNNDFKPVDLRSEFNNTDKLFSINDLKRFNLTNPENQVIDTKDDIPDNLNNSQVFGTEEMKEISTSPSPEKNDHFLVSRATIKPMYLTSTVEDKLYSTVVDKNNPLKNTANHTDELNNEENYTNHDILYEPTPNNIHTTPNYKPNKNLSFDLDNTLKTKNPERILESNVDEHNNTPKTNYSEEVTTVGDLSLAEKENDFSENNRYCNCNKKVVKNILSSTMIQNITEIKTDSYVPRNNINMKSHKRSDKLQKTDINSENVTDKEIFNKNKRDPISNLLIKNPITNERTVKHKIFEPKVNTLQKSILDLDEKRNTNLKIIKNTLLQKRITPKSKIQQLQINDQKKRNDKEKNSAIGVQKNKIPFIPKNSQNTNPKRLVIPSRQHIPKNDDYIGSNIEYNNVDDISGNKRVSTLSKSLNQVPNKIISHIPSLSLPGTFKENTHYENNVRKYPEHVISKLKYEVPVTFKEQNILRNNGGNNNTDDDITVKKASISPKSLLQIPKKTNQNPYVENTRRKHLNNDFPKTSKIINRLDVGKSRKPLDLVEDSDRSQINNIPKYRYDGIETYSTDIPMDSGTSSKYTIGLNNKVSKVLSPPRMRPMKNTKGNSTLKLKKSLIDEGTKLSTVSPISNKRMFLINNKPFLKKQNTGNNPLLRESFFTRKTDPTKNAAFQYATDLNDSFKPKVSKILHKDSSHDNTEHGPYKYEDLEPIIFDQSTDKPGSNNKNSKFAFRNSADWHSVHGNQLQNTQSFKPLHPTSIIRPENVDYYDTRKSDEGGDDVEKYEYQPDILKHASENDDNTDRYFVKDSKEKLTNQSGFEVLSRIKVDDGVFKVPLVGHTSIDKNGSAYISDIYVPIEKPNGQHSALSLSELLTGDFRYVNGYGERPLTAEQTLKVSPPLASMRTSKDPTISDVIYQPCDSAITEVLKASDDRQTAPIHIIQIINNGQCSEKHTGNDTVKKPEYKEEVSSRKFRNRGQKVSMARSKDIDNSRQINRKLENAYDHFDSDILDRFLQVYVPPTV